MQWQGPYMVTKALADGLNYELDTSKSHKQHRTYHINLLNKWQSRDEIAALIMPESPEMPLPHESNVPLFPNDETWKDVIISDELTVSQRQQLEHVFLGSPNLTSVTTHKIDTGNATPIRCSP